MNIFEFLAAGKEKRSVEEENNTDLAVENELYFIVQDNDVHFVDCF